MNDSLNITEIYASIQGEAAYAGWPCTFVRLTGCPLRCRWCDTAYSFAGGTAMTIAQVMARIGDLGIPTVELTGGEPLAQEATVPLMRQLISQGYRVMIETSGAEPIESIPQDVHIIMDLKCPGSRMESSNRYENLATLKVTDEVKFVVADRADFEWARSVMADYRLEGRVNVLLSPAFGLVKPADLAQWIIEDRLNARLNLQQHKYIWHPKAKGV